MKQLDGEGWDAFQSQTVSRTDFPVHSEEAYTKPGRKVVDSTYTDQFKIFAVSYLELMGYSANVGEISGFHESFSCSSA